ncbi:MAG: thioredoxin family protein, partial [Bacteroidales bacterium]|nr:thioredoxin family protein [Bacteroidales bacterium]
QMRELYQQFEGRGFEIYQVSLDTDEHFWKTSALNLPWVCVRDSRSLASPYLPMYNVQQIPTFFLIDKEGHLVARDETIKDLAKEIVDLLRK